MATRMPINRRPRRLSLAAALALLALLAGCGGGSQVESEPLRISAITSENQTSTANRYLPLTEYLAKKLGRPVEMREASDYAAVVEALKARRLDLAYFGPASYSRAWMVTGGKVVPLVSPTDWGIWGYYSTLVVRADSPYQTLDDLKGKSIAFVDPNSTSGFQAPTYYLTRQGYPPEEFFGGTGYSGSHDNGIMAVLNGAYDAAVTWWENDNYSSFKRMEIQGMIDASDLRVIWKSPPLPDRPWAVHADMPAETREQIAEAMLSLPQEAPEVWRHMTDGEFVGFQRVTHGDYVDVVDMLRQNDAARRNAP